MNWLLKIGGGFLTSKFSGYLALAALSGVLGLGWYIDNLRSNYALLQEKCLQRTNPAAESFAEELRDANQQKFDELRSILADAEHACLEWVYDPNNPPAGTNPPVPNPFER